MLGICQGQGQALVRPFSLDCLGRSVRRQMGAQDFFYLELEQSRLFVIRKTHADALGAIACRAGRRDPRDLSGNRITLRVIRQGHQHINICAQLVFTGCRDEHAAVFKQRNISCVKRRFFLDRQLHDAGSGGCEHRELQQRHQDLFREPLFLVLLIRVY